MRNTVFTAGALVALSAGLANAQMFGVGRFDSFSTQGLYAINPLTGAASLVGDTGLREIADIAWDINNGRMLALTVRADLYQINLATGAATLLAQSAGTLPEGSLTVGPTGVIYTNDADVIGTLDPLSAAFTAVGPTGSTAFDISGMAFGPTGRLFAFAANGNAPEGSQLLEINPATGVGTIIGPTGIFGDTRLGGLAFDLYGNANGGLYLTEGSRLFTVDLGTGAASLVGSFGVPGMSGIAFIPAPGSLALVGIAGLAVARRRR
jgi:hypothetical protein